MNGNHYNRTLAVFATQIHQIAMDIKIGQCYCFLGSAEPGQNLEEIIGEACVKQLISPGSVLANTYSEIHPIPFHCIECHCFLPHGVHFTSILCTFQCKMHTFHTNTFFNTFTSKNINSCMHLLCKILLFFFAHQKFTTKFR